VSGIIIICIMSLLLGTNIKCDFSY